MVRINREQLFWLGVMVLAIFLLFLAREVLVPFVLAIFLTYLTLPAVELLVGREVPRSIAIISVYLLLAIVVWAVTVYILPTIFEDLNTLLTNLQQQTERLDGWARYLYLRYQRLNLPEAFQTAFNQGIQSGREFLQNLILRIIDLIIQVISHSVYLILAPVLSYYMTRDVKIIKETVIHTFPRTWRPEVAAIGREINKVLSGFVRGQLLVSVFVGLSITLGVVILSVPYALVIGLVAGIANIIPYFGPIVGAIPAILAAVATRQTSKIVYVILIFLVVNQFEGAVLAPKILQDRVGLHPTVVIFALLLGGKLFGLLGTLVAVPVAAIIKVIFLYCRAKFAPVDRLDIG